MRKPNFLLRNDWPEKEKWDLEGKRARAQTRMMNNTVWKGVLKEYIKATDF